MLSNPVFSCMFAIFLVSCTRRSNRNCWTVRCFVRPFMEVYACKNRKHWRRAWSTMVSDCIRDGRSTWNSHRHHRGHVTATMRATTIGAGALKFFTIEHLMSALHVHGIDNCRVTLDAEEPPVADGSARAFFALIARAGSVEQDAVRQETVIDRVYRVDDGSHFVMALPYDGLRVSFTSLNEHPLIGVQYYDIEVTPAAYEREIAPARTIAYEKEIAALRAHGLGLGGSLETVIVYNDEGWMNPLNFPNELVRHKILDVIGDIRLAGMVRGHIIAVASGHALNTALAKEIAGERDQA